MLHVSLQSVCVYVCMLDNLEIRERHQVPLSGITDGCDPRTIWVQGIKLQSFVRAARALNH